jgi:hypothetical protein
VTLFDPEVDFCGCPDLDSDMRRILIKLTVGGINEAGKHLLRSPGSDPVICVLSPKTIVAR